MSLAEAPNYYTEAVVGSPLNQLLSASTLDTTMPFWVIGNWAISIPNVSSEHVQGIDKLVSELQNWTGWSLRRIAELLGTSHTTVRAIANGRRVVIGHSGDLEQRLLAVHGVIERLFLLMERDTLSVRSILNRETVDHETVGSKLKSGEYNRAYLIAIDFIRPRRAGLIVGDRPKLEPSTVPLHE